MYRKKEKEKEREREFSYRTSFITLFHSRTNSRRQNHISRKRLFYTFKASCKIKK